MEEVSRTTRRVYGYSNNHFHGFAVENSLKMLSLMGAATSEQEELGRSVTERIEAKSEK